MKSRVVMLFVTVVLLVTLTTGAAGAGDPWGQQAKLIASDGASESYLGFSAALDGDTAVVGAIGDNSSQGAAYIFTRAEGIWHEQAKLTASDGNIADKFGNAIALDGDTALVGAYGDDAGRGAVYVFTRTGSVWSEQQILTLSDRTENDLFGSSIAIYGDTALVGAVYKDSSMGAAYIFTRTNGTWSQQAKLTASNRAVNDFFGISVALSGNAALIGASYDAGCGAAYIFTRTGTTWSQQARLAASDGAANEQFGSSVALDGDTALVGAISHDETYYHQGAAYVFTQTSEGWRQQAKLTASDAAVVTLFGSSTALEGNTTLIGASGDNNSRGAAYLFTRTSGVWRQQQKLTAADDAIFQHFGNAVGLSGGTALIGASSGNGAVSSAGAAYVFTTSPQKLIWLPVVQK